jgi:pyruvate dehydrogenase E2 component (dihydrolipoamide acetyltransferase)
MAKSYRLPDLGEGVHEAEVISVHVSAGQGVNEGDLILVVETDKASVEIPSPFTGTVLEILVKPGDRVEVEDVMMTFGNGEETEETATEASAPVPPGEVAVDKAAPAETPPPEIRTGKGPVPASPATRRLARELGVDLRMVTPTGSGGVVTADDVRGFAGKAAIVEEPVPASPVPAASPAPLSPTAPGLPDFGKWGTVERVPFRSIRRATARQMTLSWSRIPHVNSQDEVDVTRLEAFRQKHKAQIQAEGGRLTYTVFALKAVTAALKACPQFNSTLDVETGEIVLKKYYHIGIAVNTDDGLIVPVIRDVDRKSIRELAVELDELTRRTRSRKVKLDELQGGTFTITNAGALGGRYFSPIINYPEVAILGMGQARMQPVVRGEKDAPEIVPRLIMPLVLCIDHRVLDGADANRFLGVLISTLRDPDELLMSMS